MVKRLILKIKDNVKVSADVGILGKQADLSRVQPTTTAIRGRRLKQTTQAAKQHHQFLNLVWRVLAVLTDVFLNAWAGQQEEIPRQKRAGVDGQRRKGDL